MYGNSTRIPNRSDEMNNLNQTCYIRFERERERKRGVHTCILLYFFNFALSLALIYILLITIWRHGDVNLYYDMISTCSYIHLPLALPYIHVHVSNIYAETTNIMVKIIWTFIRIFVMIISYLLHLLHREKTIWFETHR